MHALPGVAPTHRGSAMSLGRAGLRHRLEPGALLSCNDIRIQTLLKYTCVFLALVVMQKSVNRV